MMLSKTSLLLLALISSAFALPGTTRQRLTRRSLASCTYDNALATNNYEYKPNTAVASICYNGAYSLDNLSNSGYVFHSQPTCEENHFLFKRRSRLDCFYMLGHQKFTILDDGGSDNLFMFYADFCKWDGKTLDCTAQ